MNPQIEQIIEEHDRAIAMIYEEMCLAPAKHRRQWMRRIDKALDIRLDLMRLRQPCLP